MIIKNTNSAMYLTHSVKEVLKNYQSESPAVKTNIVRILMSGKLAGTGRLVILPVDQGFEHGPIMSFSKNKESFDPEYHAKLTAESGLNAYAAPKGMLESIGDELRGAFPLIMKMNSSNNLLSNKNPPYQGFTATVKDAIYQGCCAVGYTIYPGSDFFLDFLKEIAEQINEAKAHGLAVVIWSYPRGGDITKKGETALDIICYAAHIAALIGGNIIKVKLPENYIEREDSKTLLDTKNFINLEQRVKHVVQSSFANKRLLLFSGGASKKEEELLKEVKADRNGGGTGSIIGRNVFQRPRAEALDLLNKVIDLYV